MLGYWQNGKEITINAIHSSGKAGQLVIYGERVNWGAKASPTFHPLSQYPFPSIFTIVKESDGPLGDYVLRDSNGKCINLPKPQGQYLYDAQKWLTWNNMREEEKTSRKQRKIEQLEGHVDLLKDILIKQGSRVITDLQATALGINE